MGVCVHGESRVGFASESSLLVHRTDEGQARELSFGTEDRCFLERKYRTLRKGIPAPFEKTKTIGRFSVETARTAPSEEREVLC